MSTSAIDRKCVKLALYDLLFAAVTALGGFVYEQFSHEVYSGFMVYAFLPPLVLGLTVLTLGLWIPDWLWNFLKRAAALIGA